MDQVKFFVLVMSLCFAQGVWGATWNERMVEHLAAAPKSALSEEKGFASDAMAGGDEAKQIEVDIKGWKKLWLIVDKQGDYNYDLVHWGEPVFIDAAGKETRVSSLKPISAKQEWGSLGIDKAATGGALLYSGNKEAMTFGLGTHAQSEICFDVSKQTFLKFRSWIGVDRSRPAGEGKVKFLVQSNFKDEEQDDMADIWKKLDAEFTSKAMRDEMSLEKSNKIWTDSATPALVAKKYVAATRLLSHRERAQMMVPGVKTWENVWPIRALFIEATLAEQAAAAADKWRLRPVEMALEDLIATYGPKYPKGADYLKQLRALDAELKTATAERKMGIVAELNKLKREALLANPLLDFDRILTVRRRPKADARTAMDGAIGMVNNWRTMQSIGIGAQLDDSIVELSNLRGDVKEKVVFQPEKKQAIIDAEIHFNADRIAFAMTGEKEKNFRLWEVGIDGANPHQISPDDGEDVAHADPCYLPDGKVIFTSTAVYQGLPCTFGGDFMMCLYRLDPADKSVRQLTFEQDSNWSPTLLPNGRIMYQRWEYTDAAHSNSRMLFSMNPDGTDQRELRGSGSWFPGAFFFARPIPGQSRQVVGVAGGHHDRCRSGRLFIFDTTQGRRDDSGVVAEIPYHGKKTIPVVRDGLIGGRFPQFLHPYPLSKNYHLVTMKPERDIPWGIYLVDTFDNMILIKDADDSAYIEPAPVVKQAPPPMVPDRVNLASKTARVHIQDIYSGPGLEGVPRGVVKGIRVIEYYFSRRNMGGLYGTIGMDGPWDVKRILGVAPVKEDGSAYFNVPANCTVSLQPIDAKGQALQIMRSWVIGQPGETISCAGCHENQDMAPPPSPLLNRKPDDLKEWYGAARGFSFIREVQPVLDRYCVGCHNGTKAKPDFSPNKPINDWKTAMAGNWGQGGKFTQAYFNLWRYLRTPGIEGDRRMFTPMDYHFSQTELAQMLMKKHSGVELDKESFERLAAWHDFNAPFFGAWGEIPGLNPVVERTATRAKELRAKYSPVNNDIDMEAYPQVQSYDMQFIEPKMKERPKKEMEQTLPDSERLTPAQAVDLQQKTAPGGQIIKVVEIPLSSLGKDEAPKAKYVRVECGEAHQVTIGEIGIYSAGKNVASKGSAWMSDDGGDGLTFKELLAVDGNPDTVAQTRQADMAEFWETIFEQPLTVERITLSVPRAEQAAMLKDARLVVMDDSRRVLWRKRLDFAGKTSMEFDIKGSTCDKVRFEFAWVPPGKFQLGGDAYDARPIQVQTLAKGFWMLTTEMTNEQMHRFNPLFESRMEDRHGYQFGVRSFEQDMPDQPAVRVTWREAMAFCEWLSKESGTKVTLPTEAQWERAARAGTDSQFWWGGLDEDFSTYANLGDYMLAYFSCNPYSQSYKQGWYKNPENPYDNWIPQDARFNDSGFITEPVGKWKPNPWGLYDMNGNAREWTRSKYLDYPYADTGDRNATATSTADQRVTRGGSWRERPRFCTAWHRLPYPTWQKVYNVGFRPILE
jgi:formylglycine-generating enzyme required for sulfatase activity